MIDLKQSAHERESRLGRNEGVFRVINGEIDKLNTVFAAGLGDLGDQEFVIVCECGEMRCMEQIPMRSETYARVRTDPTLFFLVPGHEDLTVEGVAEAHQDYVVVKKPSGSPAGIAADSTTAA